MMSIKNWVWPSKLVFLLIWLLSCNPLAAQQDQNEFNCFSILVGRNSSDNGAVYFAHNEDDFGKQLVNWFIQDHQYYHEGEEVVLKNGGRLNQVEQTNRFLWLELPGMDFSDSYLNEYGVCIASNSCPSREDNPDISDGGIGYRLRGLMAERAVSARDAVRIGGALIERFGYTGSGRSYCISDPNEAWVLAAVKGKHWIAQRVPDDAVMVLPNNYTIAQVNLEDTENFLGSKDLITYAISRGWYDPDKDGSFNFKKVYASKGSLSHPGNLHRLWGAYHLLDPDLPRADDYPFAFIPKARLSKQDLMRILEYHYEGTDLDKSDGYKNGSPYECNGSMICGKASVYGFVAELRSWFPQDIGCLLWIAPQWPDIQLFIPWYLGIEKIPEAYFKPNYLQSLQNHYTPPDDIHVRDEQLAFFTFVSYSEKMNEQYGKLISATKKHKNKIELALIKKQNTFEKKALKMYRKNPEKGRAYLCKYTSALADYAYKSTRKKLK